MISIHPYLRNSRSVLALLALAEERKVPMKVRTKLGPLKGIVVNWGMRKEPLVYRNPVETLNEYGYLQLMTDKLRFFRHVGHDSGLVPDWTDSRDVAAGWEGDVVVRLKTAASGGEGLSISTVDDRNNGKPLIAAPLYTKYVKKADEYRCHVFRDEEGGFSIGLSQRKAAKRNEAGELEVKDWRVRNLENGFVFAKNDGHILPDAVVKCVNDLMVNHFPGLDFVALDVIYNKHDDKAYVLEGNTAPGLDGTTTEVYLNYFMERLDA
jgi:hypothetical protein